MSYISRDILSISKENTTRLEVLQGTLAMHPWLLAGRLSLLQLSEGVGATSLARNGRGVLHPNIRHRAAGHGVGVSSGPLTNPLSLSPHC